MIDPNQIPQIKQQIIQQIEATFPPEKKDEAIAQIQQMGPEQLEKFLVENQKAAKEQQPQTPQCIFCSIIGGTTPTYQIDDNKQAIAILEINPISKGHSLILPREHLAESNKLPQPVFSLAKKIAKKLKSKFKPKEVKIISANIMGHEMLNVLPIYEKESMESPRQKADEKNLEKMKKLLEKKTRKKVVKKVKAKKVSSKKIWLPKRIP
jgi:histidine triad (HIT) family protein